MLRHIDATSLREIKLEYTGPGALFLQEIGALFQTIRERCSPSALRSIEINLRGRNGLGRRRADDSYDKTPPRLFQPRGARYPYRETYWLWSRQRIGGTLRVCLATDATSAVSPLAGKRRLQDNTRWAHPNRPVLSQFGTIDYSPHRRNPLWHHLWGIDNFFSDSCCFKFKELDIRTVPTPNSRCSPPEAFPQLRRDLQPSQPFRRGFCLEFGLIAIRSLKDRNCRTAFGEGRRVLDGERTRKEISVYSEDGRVVNRRNRMNIFLLHGYVESLV